MFDQKPLAIRERDVLAAVQAQVGFMQERHRSHGQGPAAATDV
jgi:hypothetical protein